MSALYDLGPALARAALVDRPAWGETELCAHLRGELEPDACDWTDAIADLVRVEVSRMRWEGRPILPEL